jgi:hypothetical protein
MTFGKKVDEICTVAIAVISPETAPGSIPASSDTVESLGR